MNWRCANNARAMRAARIDAAERHPVRRVINSFFLMLALCSVAVFGAGLLMMALSIASANRVRGSEAEIRRDCSSDAMNYCWAAVITASRAKIIRCMLVNRSKLSPECKRHIREQP